MENKIFMLMGKSSAGKDTIKNLVVHSLQEDWDKFRFSEAVMYTTRPIRTGEVDGVAYHFVDRDFLEEARSKNMIVEERNYNTVHGIWTYFTHVDSMNLENHNYIYLNTLEAYSNLVKFYGKDSIIPMYIWVDDGERLQRALEREKKQSNPKYEEMCRRFIADQEDFSEEKLSNIHNLRRYNNIDLESCTKEIVSDIKRLVK